jgi:hypothetical protein
LPAVAAPRAGDGVDRFALPDPVRVSSLAGWERPSRVTPPGCVPPDGCVPLDGDEGETFEPGVCWDGVTDATDVTGVSSDPGTLGVFGTAGDVGEEPSEPVALTLTPATLTPVPSRGLGSPGAPS